MDNLTITVTLIVIAILTFFFTDDFKKIVLKRQTKKLKKLQQKLDNINSVTIKGERIEICDNASIKIRVSTRAAEFLFSVARLAEAHTAFLLDVTDLRKLASDISLCKIPKGMSQVTWESWINGIKNFKEAADVFIRLANEDMFEPLNKVKNDYKVLADNLEWFNNEELPAIDKSIDEIKEKIHNA